MGTLLVKIFGSLFRMFVVGPLTFIFAIYVFRDGWQLYNLPWQLPSQEILIGIGLILSYLKGSVFAGDAAEIGFRAAQVDAYYKALDGGEGLRFSFNVFFPSLLIGLGWAMLYFYHWILTQYGYLTGV